MNATITDIKMGNVFVVNHEIVIEDVIEAVIIQIDMSKLLHILQKIKTTSKIIIVQSEVFQLVQLGQLVSNCTGKVIFR